MVNDNDNYFPEPVILDDDDLPEHLKLITRAAGRLSPVSKGEHYNVLDIINRTLADNQMNWCDLSNLIVHGYRCKDKNALSDEEILEFAAAKRAEGVAEGEQLAEALALSRKPPPPDAGERERAGWEAVDSVRLIKKIEEMRACCSFNEASESFLDGLLTKAEMYSTVYFSVPKMRKWFHDLELKAAAAARRRQS